jgi:hypothetical protein
MQFTVNGKTYFLNFVPDEGRWFLFQATSRGIRRIPVIDDAAPITGPVLFAPTDADEQRDVN